MIIQMKYNNNNYFIERDDKFVKSIKLISDEKKHKHL
jgi:hypothetical protein